jgi:hypothetical protein
MNLAALILCYEWETTISGIMLAISLAKIKANNMKKILFALCLACAISPAMAQNAEGAGRAGNHERMKMSAEERARFTTDKMQEKLSLSADQHAKILAVNTEAGKRMQAMRTSESRPDKSAFEAIDKYREEQYTSILTQAQMEQWKAFRSEQHGMRGKGEWMRQPADAPAKQEVPATK